MRRREFIGGLGSVAAWPLVARAQQAAMPVIGYLDAGSLETRRENVAALHHGLSETGYFEGRNLAVEYRGAENRLDRLPALAADLVRHQVAVIIATPTPAAVAAKAATQSIPIVFTTGADPVEIGLVASLNRPGGNLTGMANLTTAVAAKRLALLHELMPAATLIAYLVNPTNPVYVTSGVNLTENHRFEFPHFAANVDLRRMAAGCGHFPAPHHTCRHMHTRSSPSVTERGRVTVPCKDWPSATASGGCGLDKGLPPGLRLPPRDRRWSTAGDEHRGRSNDRAGRTAIAISNRWFSGNFSLALTVFAEPETKELQAAARTLGVRLLILNASDPSEFEAAFAALVLGRAGGLVVGSDTLFQRYPDQLVALAARYRLPAIYGYPATAAAGGLMSYGTDFLGQFRQAGAYVGRILKGERPADLPVQQVTKMGLVINLKTAKALGLTIPETLLATADEVIQ